ncbi:MAG: helix-turn-helix transcriptional regulator [Firmicutes bacterium]|nr:helix-turn-helix transcriptional regulator [Bacillota bacterium]
MPEPNRKIKAARVEIGKTQKDMASFLEICPKSYISKENNDIDFTESEIDKLLNYFNRKYEDLFMNV